MHENFSIKAKWWLPGKMNERPVFGTLHYETSGKLMVTMDESLYGTTDLHEAAQDIPIPLVYGLGEDHKPITLYDVKGWEVGSTDWVRMELYPEYVFISEDKHFAVEEMEVTNFNFCLNGFGSFFRFYSNRLVSEHPADNQTRFTYKQPDPIEIIEDENLNIYFYFHHRYSGMSDTANGAFTFMERIFLNVSPKDPIGFKEFTRQLKFYSDFFRLFSQEILSFDTVNIFLKAPEEEKAKFRLIFRQASEKVGISPSVFHPLAMYNDIENSIGKLMRKWIDLREYVTGGLALFMQTKYMRSQSPAQLFLNYVFAMETLHKTFLGNQRPIHLSQRLRELIDQNQDLLSYYQLDEPRFIEKVFKQRNYLAHDHSVENHSHITPDEYNSVNILLQMIFELTLLRLLGIEEELLKKLARRNDRYEQLANWRGSPF